MNQQNITRKKGTPRKLVKKNIFKNEYGVMASIQLKNNKRWNTRKYDNFIECIEAINTYFNKNSSNSSKLYIKYLAIAVDVGTFVVKKNIKNDFDMGGIYNICSDVDILRIDLGNKNTIINDFSLSGVGFAQILGSCCINLINLSALEETISDGRVVKHYPNFTIQKVVWSGALWFDFTYTNHNMEVRKNKWGLNEYYKGDKKIVEAPRVEEADWVDFDTVDMMYILTTTVRLPAPTPLHFPNNIYRRKPLFVLNSFSSLRHQMWNCTIYSLVGPIQTKDQICMILLNNLVTPKTSHPDWLISSVKFGAEIYGKFYPICLEGNNLSKVGILNSSISGKMLLEAKACAIMNCYLLAVGTDDGSALTKENPVTKVLIIKNGPAAKHNLQQKAHGVVAPCRVILDGNAFISTSAVEITEKNYKDCKTCEKYLPWTLINEGKDVIPFVAFSSNFYWIMNAPFKKGTVTDDSQASGGVIQGFGILHLTNSKRVEVNLPH